MARKNKKPEIDPADDDFGAVLNYAVRYTLGRETYAPGLVQDFIRPLLPKLSPKTLAVMERDIREAGKTCGYGDPNIDEPGWMKFLADIRQAMYNRGIERFR